MSIFQRTVTRRTHVGFCIFSWRECAMKTHYNFPINVYETHSLAIQLFQVFFFLLCIYSAVLQVVLKVDYKWTSHLRQFMFLHNIVPQFTFTNQSFWQGYSAIICYFWSEGDFFAGGATFVSLCALVQQWRDDVWKWLLGPPFSLSDPALYPRRPGNGTHRYSTLEEQQRAPLFESFWVAQNCSPFRRCKKKLLQTRSRFTSAMQFGLAQPLFRLYKWPNSAHIIQLIYWGFNRFF